ncbi:MAG: DUF2938 family protein [Candidatus Puniceispirillales bacterium]|jgi:hypothetical protein|nr:DUF2938 family protein [Pseudomonadota bacterium]
MEVVHIIIIGILSCVAMDLWQRILKIIFQINPSDWAVVGRWFVLLITSGKLYNPNIDSEQSIKNELPIGWIVHYSVAILYSLVFFIFYKFQILNASYLDGIVFGLISVIVPWFFFMPILGKGFLATKTPSPLMACSLAIGSHFVIGLSIGSFFQIFGY